MRQRVSRAVGSTHDASRPAAVPPGATARRPGGRPASRRRAACVAVGDLCHDTGWASTSACSLAAGSSRGIGTTTTGQVALRTHSSLTEPSTVCQTRLCP